MCMLQTLAAQYTVELAQWLLITACALCVQAVMTKPQAQWLEEQGRRILSSQIVQAC